MATSLEALAVLEGLIPRRCSHFVDSQCWLLAGCLSSPQCGSDPSEALFFKWPPLQVTGLEEEGWEEEGRERDRRGKPANKKVSKM